jgi:hypothetical protein
LFSLASLLRIAEVVKILGLFFSCSTNYVLILTEKFVGLHFGRLFRKLIWSPCLSGGSNLKRSRQTLEPDLFSSRLIKITSCYVIALIACWTLHNNRLQNLNQIRFQFSKQKST